MPTSVKAQNYYLKLLFQDPFNKNQDWTPNIHNKREIYRPAINWLQSIENNLSESAQDDYEEDADDEDDLAVGRFSDFQSPRNKKLFFNLPYRFIPKRAPSGFMGMRGKKFLESSIKRGPSGFVGMRGKKSSWDPLYGLLHNYNYESNDYLDTEQEKRAPAGFFGMRGKKWDELFEAFDKRSPSGFHGMRGKKENGFYSSPRFNDLMGDTKRSPKMGFHGMRGKRSLENSNRRSNYGLFSVLRMPHGKQKYEKRYFADDEEEPMTYEKRAPNGFMGMRGKKS